LTLKGTHIILEHAKSKLLVCHQSHEWLEQWEKNSNDFTYKTQADALLFSSFISQEQHPKFQLQHFDRLHKDWLEARAYFGAELKGQTIALTHHAMTNAPLSCSMFRGRNLF